VILLIYALLPETSRFSRAVTIFGAVWTAIAMNALRYLFHSIKLKGYPYDKSNKKRILIIGARSETERVALIAQTNSLKPEIILTVEDVPSVINKNFIKKYKINELILCLKDVSIKHIISYFTEFKSCTVSYKIAPENEQVIIGSRNIQRPVELSVI
jgi:FlaA1/EpsC-like NDP-sugar epimerase